MAFWEVREYEVMVMNQAGQAELKHALELNKSIERWECFLPQILRDRVLCKVRG